MVPLLAAWWAFAYALPPPVGPAVPAIPCLALPLAGEAFVLAYALGKTTDVPRRSTVSRNTVVGGAAIGRS